jgi:hypothetical protein
MKSAFECFHRAAQCEQQAAEAVDPARRTLLLHAAEHWRARGRAAQAKIDGGAEQIEEQTGFPGVRVKP